MRMLKDHLGSSTERGMILIESNWPLNINLKNNKYVKKMICNSVLYEDDWFSVLVGS